MTRRGAHDGAAPSPTAHKAPALHQQLQQTAWLVGRVRRGASMNELLPQLPAGSRPGCQALAFHALRWWGSAQAARQILAQRPPPPAVDDLLSCALALLWPASTPPYAEHTVVDESVRCVRKMAPASAGFVNAVLRQFLRRRDEIVATVQTDPQGRWNHPDWWIRRLRQDWPQQAEAILQAAQEHPPMTLRASHLHGGLAQLGPVLQAAGLSWSAAALGGNGVAGSGAGVANPLAQAITLAEPVPVQAIPGFEQGHWSVQDASAQLAAPLLLGGWTGRRVLDACSAPGGKTAHLLDLALAGGHPIDLMALDADAQRLQRVRQTLQRLHLPGPGGGTVRLQAADARAVASWWDGEPFDAVLLDAPCSASGIVRRHPDARWLKREADIQALARIQAELLDALWPLVRPGGRLLYATCSVFKAEGCEQIDAFLQRQGLPPGVIDPHSPGHLLPLTDNHSRATPDGSTSSPDGFFYALLHKPS